MREQKSYENDGKKSLGGSCRPNMGTGDGEPKGLWESVGKGRGGQRKSIVYSSEGGRPRRDCQTCDKNS